MAAVLEAVGLEEDELGYLAPVVSEVQPCPPCADLQSPAVGFGEQPGPLSRIPAFSAGCGIRS